MLKVKVNSDLLGLLTKYPNPAHPFSFSLDGAPYICNLINLGDSVSSSLLIRIMAARTNKANFELFTEAHLNAINKEGGLLINDNLIWCLGMNDFMTMEFRRMIVTLE